MRLLLRPREARTRRAPRLLPLALLLAAAAPSLASPAPPEAAWPPVHEGTWEGALAEAAERNVPVVCVLLQDGESTNDTFYREVYLHPDFRAALADTILLVADDAEHEKRELQEQAADGTVTTRSVCSRFGTSDCELHQRYARPIFDLFKSGGGDDGVLKTPLFGILLPDGGTHTRLQDVTDRARILERLADARKIVGPGLSEETVKAMKVDVRAGQDALGAGHPGAAWRAFDAALALGEKGTVADEAREGRTRAPALLDELVAEAHAHLEAGRIADGWKGLVALVADCAGTPLARAAAAASKAVEKDKRWRDEIRQLQHEEEADALYEEVRARWTAGDERKAIRLGKRLLDRYGDTKAAARMIHELRELYDRIQEDPR